MSWSAVASPQLENPGGLFLGYDQGQTFLRILMQPPVAPRHPHETFYHDTLNTDHYFWLREKTHPDTIPYLEAENAYTQQMMAPTEALQDQLYKEILGRIKETDLSVPTKLDDYFYYSRTEEGKQYGIHCRKQGSLEAPEMILLDENIMAEGHEYFSLGAFLISPDHTLLIYSVDTDGDECFTLYIKNVITGEILPEVMTNTSYGIEWDNSNTILFYTTLDAAKRTDKLFRHRIGTPITEDVLVYHETDESFFISIDKSRSQKFLFLDINSMDTGEVYYLSADQPTDEFILFAPRVDEIEYSIDHHGDSFYILTNENAKNFKLLKTPVANPEKSNWLEILPHRPLVKLEGIDLFEDYQIVYEREDGLIKMQITEFATAENYYLDFPEPVYTASPAGNPEYATTEFRFSYTSLVTPHSVYDYDLKTKTRTLKKQQEVVGGYDAERFRCERLHATAQDGTRIPISLVYKKDIPKDGTAPCYLYAYGSYGVSMDPTFSSTRLSLLERGFVYAIAHIRGGGELGRDWYEQGKFLQKKNTFTDFITCAEFLIQEQYTSAQYLAIAGGSAGGLLMGAVVNLRPDLFGAVVADVPFVDVTNTMMDASLPLTVTEYDEWGNPNDRQFFDYMKSYSPYENVCPQAYPSMLITAGLNDPRVSYWEPAKFTAKLRATKTDSNLLLLKTNMGAGHGGASGRYGQIQEMSFEYAFILQALGKS
jgi:oligopeptidase B